MGIVCLFDRVYGFIDETWRVFSGLDDSCSSRLLLQSVEDGTPRRSEGRTPRWSTFDFQAEPFLFTSWVEGVGEGLSPPLNVDVASNVPVAVGCVHNSGLRIKERSGPDVPVISPNFDDVVQVLSEPG